METHSRDGLSFVLRIKSGDINVLAPLRQFTNLEISRSDNFFWVKGFVNGQEQDSSVLSIMNSNVFELRDNMLFVPGNKVPSTSLPAGILWHPIKNALKIKLPSFNENLFEINGEIEISLTPSNKTQKTTAQLVGIKNLNKYINNNVSQKFRDLQWFLISDRLAIIIGDQRISLPSANLWKSGQWLIPAGYDFTQSYQQTILKNSGFSDSSLFLIQTDNTFIEIPTESLVELTRSSVNLTLKQNNPV